jgi:hypothetical protein
MHDSSVGKFLALVVIAHPQDDAGFVFGCAFQQLEALCCLGCVRWEKLYQHQIRVQTIAQKQSSLSII